MMRTGARNVVEGKLVSMEKRAVAAPRITLICGSDAQQSEHERPEGNHSMPLRAEFQLVLLDKSRKIVVAQIDAALLRNIGETGSIAEAARILGISYRNAWGRITKLESSVKE